MYSDVSLVTNKSNKHREIQIQPAKKVYMYIYIYVYIHIIAYIFIYVNTWVYTLKCIHISFQFPPMEVDTTLQNKLPLCRP